MSNSDEKVKSMATIQTAISLEESLYEKVNTLAEEMKILPNELLTLAIEEYLKRHHTNQLLESIQEAYADGLDESEKAMLEGMRRHQRQLQEREW
jgi:metal-responsive CopG/Arc/MetJ family transcriptional regulator